MTTPWLSTYCLRLLLSIAAGAALTGLALEQLPHAILQADDRPQARPKRASFDDDEVDNQAVADQSPWMPSEFDRSEIEQKLAEGDPVAAFEVMCDWRLDPRLSVAVLTAKHHRPEELNRSIADANGKVDPDAVERMLERVHRTIATARQSAEPLRVFRERIASDPENAGWYRLAYLAFVRSFSEAPFDFELATPLLSDGQPDVRTYRRCIDVLVTLKERKLKFDDLAMQFARRRLEEVVRRPGFAIDPIGVAWAKRHQPLMALRQNCPPEQIGEVDGIARELLGKIDARSFFPMAFAAGITPQQVYSWQLERKLTVDYRKQPLKEVLNDLFGKAPIARWIEPEVVAANVRVDLTMTGTLREVLERALDNTGFAMEPAPMDMLWIGSRERRKAFDEQMAALIARLPAAGRMRTALELPVFVRAKDEYPGVVTSDFSEQTGATVIRTSEEVDEKIAEMKVTLNVDGLPMALALSRWCQNDLFDWIATENCAVVGGKDGVKFYREFLNDQAVRLAALQASGNRSPIAVALQRLISFDFTETPLTDVVEYFKDYTKVSIVLDMRGCEVAQVEVDEPITLHVENVPFSLALTLLCRPRGMDWVIRDDVIIISDRDNVLLEVELAAKRIENRKTYSPFMASFLLKQVNLRLADETVYAEADRKLEAVLQRFEKAAGIRIDRSAIDSNLETPYAALSHGIPADEALDRLCIYFKYDWRFHEPNRIEFFQRP